MVAVMTWRALLSGGIEKCRSTATPSKAIGSRSKARKQQWGKLTDDDLMYLEGKEDQLAGKIQERYGIAREEAERQVKEFRTSNNW
jgi:uncharacterized protein YjbJ (UPF0337 family)